MGFWTWSVVIHVVIALILWTRANPPPAPADRVEVDFVTNDDELKPAPVPTTPRPPRPRATVTPRQVVEQEHRLNDEVDPNTRFLSAFDQKVLQQTRAERSGKFDNSINGARETSHGHAARPGRSTTARSADAHPPGEIGSLGDLLPKYDQPDAVDRVAADRPDGDPTRTDDYLKDIKPGLQTLISTREFVYYAYYNRIKAALRSHWEPQVRERVATVLRQGRQLAAAHDRVTQVVVTLDASGELLGVQVLSQSGLADLDDAAVEAFKRAAPFPNPPRGMVEVDGTVKIRWDFVLEV